MKGFFSQRKFRIGLDYDYVPAKNTANHERLTFYGNHSVFLVEYCHPLFDAKLPLFVIRTLLVPSVDTLATFAWDFGCERHGRNCGLCCWSLPLIFEFDAVKKAMFPDRASTEAGLRFS
jgi:hypothetical protein